MRIIKKFYISYLRYDRDFHKLSISDQAADLCLFFGFSSILLFSVFIPFPLVFNFMCFSLQLIFFSISLSIPCFPVSVRLIFGLLLYCPLLWSVF